MVNFDFKDNICNNVPFQKKKKIEWLKWTKKKGRQMVFMLRYICQTPQKDNYYIWKYQAN